MGWVKKSQLKGYAKGVKNLQQSQFAMVDELGKELILNADTNGRLAYLTHGSSVVPADITDNLLEQGKHSLSDLMDMFYSPLIKQSVPKAPTISFDNHTEFNFEGDMLHIDNANSDSIPIIEKKVTSIIEKYQKKVNNSIKKYSR